MKKQVISVMLLAVLGLVASCSKDDDPKNSVESVTIGTQVWMNKNLDVEHYRSGDPIPQVTVPTDWANLTTGAWCYYENNSANGSDYGKLYNWYAVNDPRGLAPEGWHVPSDAVWNTLTNYLGGETLAGGKLKATKLWNSPNTGATNSSGFTAVPGGTRSPLGNFNYFGDNGSWWSSSEASTSFAWSRWLSYDDPFVGRDDFNKRSGYSVRCVRD